MDQCTWTKEQWLGKKKQRETNRTLWKWEILTGVREPVEERISPMIKELKAR